MDLFPFFFFTKCPSRCVGSNRCIRYSNITFKYSDADFNDVSVWETPEVDIVGIGDSSLAVDVLKGKEGQASLATWGALNQIQNDSGSGYLSFQINIDSLHNEMYWCLKAETATLTTVWQ